MRQTTTTTTTGTGSAAPATDYDRERAALIRELGPLGHVLAWLDRHPRTSSALLWLLGLLLAWTVFNYRFTIPAYQ